MVRVLEYGVLCCGMSWSVTEWYPIWMCMCMSMSNVDVSMCLCGKSAKTWSLLSGEGCKILCQPHLLRLHLVLFLVASSWCHNVRKIARKNVRRDGNCYHLRSTAISRGQCFLPDLNRDFVGASVPCQTPNTSSASVPAWPQEQGKIGQIERQKDRQKVCDKECEKTC